MEAAQDMQGVYSIDVQDELEKMVKEHALSELAKDLQKEVNKSVINKINKDIFHQWEVSGGGLYVPNQ